MPDPALLLPEGLLFDPRVPAPALRTWVILRSLAAGSQETDPLTIHQLCQLTGKTRSTLYRHLSTLRERGTLSWCPHESGGLVVSFPVVAASSSEISLLTGNLTAESQYRDKCSPNLARESQNRDSPHLSPTAESQNRENASLKSSLIDHESIQIIERGRRIRKNGTAFQDSGSASQVSGETTPANLYRRLSRISPNPSQRAQIAKSVHDLEIWRATLDHWLAHGWNPRNLPGMLELYQRGGPTGCRYCHKSEPVARSIAALDSLLQEVAHEPIPQDRRIAQDPGERLP